MIKFYSCKYIDLGWVRDKYIEFSEPLRDNGLKEYVADLLVPKSLMQLIFYIPRLMLYAMYVLYTVLYVVVSIGILSILFLCNVVVSLFSLLNCVRWD